MREVQLLKNLDSPNIVKHYASFIENDYLNIIMEFADGGDLQQFIEKQKQKREFIPEYIIWDLAE